MLNENNRVDALLSLRGFACLMVVVIHCAPPRKSIIYNDFDWSWLMFAHGAIAVWIFFVLSGYLMGKVFYTNRYSPDIPGVIKFWRNRALRILPLYYFAILILSIFVYPEVLKFENWGYLFRLLTFTYHPYINFPAIKFNDVFWSLSTEVQFYLLVPFIYSLIHNRFKNPKKLIILSLIIIITTFIFRGLLWISFQNQITQDMGYAFKYWYTPLITNLDLFLSGFLINELLHNQKPILTNQNGSKSPSQIQSSSFFLLPSSFVLNQSQSFINKIFAVLLIILLFLFTAHHLYHQELWNLPNRNSGWRTLTTILILQPVTAIIASFFIFAFEQDIYQHFSKNQKLSFTTILKNPFRILEIIGNLSYGIYIWHMPIIARTYDIFNSQIPIEAFYIRLTATLILSTILATVTYYLVELPFAKWKLYQTTKK